MRVGGGDPFDAVIARKITYKNPRQWLGRSHDIEVGAIHELPLPQ
jgi:hypothetical protein